MIHIKRNVLGLVGCVISVVVASNVLDRNFTASKPNEKWVADITYVKQKEVLHTWLQ